MMTDAEIRQYNEAFKLGGTRVNPTATPSEAEAPKTIRLSEAPTDEEIAAYNREHRAGEQTPEHAQYGDNAATAAAYANYNPETGAARLPQHILDELARMKNQVEDNQKVIDALIAEPGRFTEGQLSDRKKALMLMVRAFAEDTGLSYRDAAMKLMQEPDEIGDAFRQLINPLRK